MGAPCYSKSALSLSNFFREEQLRNSLKLELPRVEKNLEKLLLQWQIDNSSPFLYNGEDYLGLIQGRKTAKARRTLGTGIHILFNSDDVVGRTPQKVKPVAASPMSTPQKMAPVTPQKSTPMKGADRTTDSGRPKLVHQATPMKLPTFPAGPPLSKPAPVVHQATPMKPPSSSTKHTKTKPATKTLPKNTV